jgi:hypothetical protein
MNGRRAQRNGTSHPLRRKTVAALIFQGSAVAAGTIESSNAMVAPTPRKNVRRGMNFFAIIIAISSF